MPLVMPIRIALSPTAKVTFPHQSMRPRCRSPLSRSLQVGPYRAEDADGHVDPEHGAPVRAASTPPATSPMNMPARPATWLMPSAKPRWSEGNASVRIAAELAISMDPPNAWSTRQPISQSARGRRRTGRTTARIESEGEHDEAGVVDPDSAEHVAQAADGDDEHGLDEPVPHDHPQQVADVARRQRVQVDAAEDRRQRDDDDRSVERGHEHGRGRVRQGHPFVAVAGSPVAAAPMGPPRHVRFRPGLSASDALGQPVEQRRRRPQLRELRGREARRRSAVASRSVRASRLPARAGARRRVTDRTTRRRPPGRGAARRGRAPPARPASPPSTGG